MTTLTFFVLIVYVHPNIQARLSKIASLKASGHSTKPAQMQVNPKRARTHTERKKSERYKETCTKVDNAPNELNFIEAASSISLTEAHLSTSQNATSALIGSGNFCKVSLENDHCGKEDRQAC
eukprot:491336-Hanusia_phi.AAC.1